MKKDVIIKWFDENMSLSELDKFIDSVSHEILPKREIEEREKFNRELKERETKKKEEPDIKLEPIYISSNTEIGEFEVIQFSKNGMQPLIRCAETYIEYKDTPPDSKKPIRIRYACKINYIEVIYNTLRKINYAINQDLKEDVVSETLLYFMNRWEKYEYNLHTIPTAVQKYKANHIDIYRKDKKQINTASDEELDSYLPKNLEYMEGLQLKELEKKEAFKKMNDALSQLDQNAREILMLVADGKSEKEIMEILKIPRGTVASRKSKSIKKLAEKLKI